MFDVLKRKLWTLGVKTVVGDVQRECSGIHTGKTNIGRGVEHSDSLLRDTSSV